MRVLFLSLNTFSRTGGIQHFNRCLQLGLCRYAAQTGGSVTHFSLHDTTGAADERYTTHDARCTFRGFAGNNLLFALALARHVYRHDVVILGHVNLTPFFLLPSFFRKKKRCLIAHGVELWQPLPRFRRLGLRSMDEVWSVSHYTAGQLRTVQQLPARVIRYFPNCLNPFLAQAPVLPLTEWNKHWRLDTGKRYILTLARLAATEQAKGYDDIIRLLPRLSLRFPDVALLLAGKWDEVEYSRIRTLADSLGVTDRVLMPGFVPEASLPALFLLAIVFALPSSKDGFGLVYLEAAWWGCPVVALRAGGAPEALLYGKLGRLAGQGNDEDLTEALTALLEAPPLTEREWEENRALIQEHYGFEAYCGRLYDMLGAT